MKHSLFTKAVTFLTLLTLVSFILVNTIGSQLVRKHYVQKRKTQLSHYSEYLRDEYFSSFMDNPTNYAVETITEQIEKTDKLMNTATWFVNADGYLLLDSSRYLQAADSIHIPKFDDTFFQSYYYTDKQLGEILSEPSLVVLLPVTEHFTMEGYIVIHCPMKNIDEHAISLLHIIQLLLSAFFITGILSLIFFWYVSIRPTGKLLNMVHSINNGKHDYAIQLNTKDEYQTLQQEIAYMDEQLKNLDNYQKNFIANVSHDFRSPLTSIKGYAEAMLDGTIPSELYNKYLDIIVFESERLSKLTNNLLSMNQFEQGKGLLDITSFDINQTIKKIGTSFEGACRKKHIKLKLIFSEKETFVNADQGKIQQVIYNLLDNAVKFSHIDSEIQIKTLEKKEKVFISIKDNGIGIPKDGIKKIWERFYKTDLSRGKDKKGTGLGLSITKEIIHAHKENIDVTSTEGAGTVFTFSLPLTTPNETLPFNTELHL